MVRKRHGGEGSYQQCKDGRWRLTISLGSDADGKRLRKYIYAPTLEELRTKHAQWIAANPTTRDPELANATLEEFATTWLDYQKARVSPSSHANYEYMINKVTEELGHLPIVGVTTYHLDRLWTQLTRAGKSRTTVMNIRRSLGTMMKRAVTWGAIVANPVSASQVPRDEKRPRTGSPPMTTWSKDQVATFLEHAKKNRLYALYYLILHTGLRRSEAFALRRSDLDLNDGRLKIQRGLVYVYGKGMQESNLKTPTAHRTLPLPASVVRVLREHVQRLNDERRRARRGRTWEEHHLLFSSAVGTPLNPDNVRRSFRKLAADAGVPQITIHGMRHTYASVALAEQLVTIPQLSAYLGHANTQVTMEIYAHHIPKQNETMPEIGL